MKKFNLQLGSIKDMLTKEQMKQVLGGDDYGAGGKKCSYVCCSSSHENCSDRVYTNNACSDFTDCAGGATCPSGGHLFYSCG